MKLHCPVRFKEIIFIRDTFRESIYNKISGCMCRWTVAFGWHCFPRTKDLFSLLPDRSSRVNVYASTVSCRVTLIFLCRATRRTLFVRERMSAVSRVRCRLNYCIETRAWKHMRGVSHSAKRHGRWTENNPY